MLKQSLTIMAICSVFALTACSKGPSESQVKEAIAEFHSNGDSAAKAQMTTVLDKSLKLKSCEPKNQGYNCTLINKTLETEEVGYFVKDTNSGDWVYDMVAP